MQRVTFKIGELSTFHRNPRVGNVEKIADSLRVNGQYRPIVVNLGSKTGRPLEVLAGNHTLLAARHLGWKSIEAVTVDVDDLAAMRIVVADNRTADLGDTDDQTLADVLSGIPDLEGTGYDDDDLLALLDKIDLETLPEKLKPEADWGEGDNFDRVPKLKIGKYTVPLSSAEFADLMKVIESWREVKGSTDGLVLFLLEGADL